MGHKVYQKYAISGKFKMGYGAKIIYKTGLIFSPYVAHFSPKKHGVIVFICIVCDLG